MVRSGGDVAVGVTAVVAVVLAAAGVAVEGDGDVGREVWRWEMMTVVLLAIRWLMMVMRTQSAGRPIAESQRGGTGVRVGWGGGRGRIPKEGCSFKKVLSCNPKEYDGKGVDVDLIWWFDEDGTCAECLGEVVVSMSWIDFKFIMIEKFCPSHEMQKLETELWNHAMVGAGHAAYTDRFHELARPWGCMAATGAKKLAGWWCRFCALTNELADNKRTRMVMLCYCRQTLLRREKKWWVLGPSVTTSLFHAPVRPCRQHVSIVIARRHLAKRIVEALPREWESYKMLELID
ncbi:hypothetical protein Tco_0941043 [Tanacetum coccineum]|uniref:Reverse transcriptase domain-containing protein n=1 Tax=Tanacetum coccineum TaxID=301880 RepID=A0ABQ5DRC0_9ASTR